MPLPTSYGLDLLSKCSELNKGAFSTFVLYRPVTGRLLILLPYSKIKQDRRLGWLKLVSTNWAVQLNVLQVAHEHN